MNGANERVWSDEQVAVFDWFESGYGNLLVRARAGTGKTTTIIEAVKRAPETRQLLAAFNKRIQEELKGRLAGTSAEAKTLHSLGCKFLFKAWGGTEIDAERGARIAKKVCGGTAPDEIIRLVSSLASKGKNMAPFPAPGDLEAIARDFDLWPDPEWEERGWTVQRVAELAGRAMDAAATDRDGTCDFDDMIFVPLRNRWVRPWYDLVVIDEAQDMNAAQLMLARKACKAGGRIAVVGDDRQAIYGFRGADRNALDRLKAELEAQELPLTTTYRCPKKVVELAARLVPDYRAAPTAPEGEVEWMVADKLVEAVRPGDFVLSRKNAPLASTCMKILKAGKRAKIEGRDVGAGLLALVEKLGKKNSIPEFLERLSKWAAKQSGRAVVGIEDPKRAEQKQGEIADKAEVLRVLAQDLASVGELKARIRDLFADTLGRGDFTVLSSVHKAKGLEAERVFVLVDTLYPGGRRGEVEEQNIEYVAVTRAKAKLFLVKDESKDGATAANTTGGF
jgi:DNA helicase-2/ATP-dependent DNA helicase PcrA